MSMVRLNESAAMPASSASATRSASPRVVAVIAFDRVSPFHLSVPCIVFGDERP